MVDIHLFGYVVELTTLFQTVMPVLVLISVVIAYLNYRKRKLPTSPPISSSQSANNSSGVVQQNANNMNIGQQTIVTNLNKQFEIPDLEITEEVVSFPLLLGDYTSERYIEAHRIKVKNKGKIAVENVYGIIEDLNYKKSESRASWHEGEKDVPYTTINAGDHMFLNIYGIIMHRSSKNLVSKTNAITMATENGWNWRKSIDTSLDLKFAIRVTAKNAAPKRKVFKISQKNNLELEFLNED